MPSFLEDCLKFFYTKDLYELLNIPKNSKSAEVKKAYYKLSLRVHPDRAEGDNESATQKFQILSKVYSVLSDSEKRAVYDDTGEVDDDSVPERDWGDYWRIHFKTITIEDIEKFKNSYQGSDEEITDVREAYLRCEGDMDKMFEFIPCFEIEDEPRIRDIITDLIKDKTVPEYRKFTKEKPSKKQKRHAKYAKEADEAEAMKKEMGLGSMSDLQKAIAKKQEQRKSDMDDFVKQLEAKYCKKKGNKKRAGKSRDENAENSNEEEDYSEEEEEVKKRPAKKSKPCRKSSRKN